MPGAAPTMTLSMEPDPETSAAMHAAPSHDGFSRIAISFVDSEGAPVSGVHVNLRGQSILHPEERQPWPTEWSSDVAFAEAGTAMIRLQLPAIPSAEKRAKMKVWFDAECPGYVPLTDQEYSLTKHLPIRMQAR